MFIYNIAQWLCLLLFRAVWRSRRLQQALSSRWPKAAKYVMGQQSLLEHIRMAMCEEAGREVLWFHAASYGEYNVIRPVVRQFRSAERRVVVTFFSPTGYEALTEENRRTHEADHVFYLPMDHPQGVRQFLDILQPCKAVFAVSEYWMNCLLALGERHIPTYFVSMLVDDDSYLKRWYCRPVRRALEAVTTFMVAGEASKRNLVLLGFSNVVVTGDPLFDNALRICREPYENTVISRFCQDTHDVFVAGSISDKKDLALVASLANANRGVRFIVVPHEISEEGLNKIVYEMEGNTRLYSECTPDTDFSCTQVLVIDFMGALSHIYRYGRWAYVGGGFTPYLHSVIEPVVYGIPVAFGPRIERKTSARQLISFGVGRVVSTKKELAAWFAGMRDAGTLRAVRDRALRYVGDSTNVTDKIIRMLA